MTHDTGRNTINKVNVTYFFGYRKGFGGCGVLVHSVHVCDFEATENDVRSKEKT